MKRRGGNTKVPASECGQEAFTFLLCSSNRVTTDDGRELENKNQKVLGRSQTKKSSGLADASQGKAVLNLKSNVTSKDVAGRSQLTLKKKKKTFSAAYRPTRHD